MARLLIYFAHPGQQYSRTNIALANTAKAVDNITFIDLYAEYPRHDINVQREQQRLLEHDVILFQFPLYWYSTPSLIKEWQDLVLQHGFAYGHDGNKLANKTMMLAITAGGPEDAYTAEGYQHYPLRTFLTPLEQTARLCKMRFASPYVLFGALNADADHEIADHAHGYHKLLTAIRDNEYDFDTADELSLLNFSNIPLKSKV
ncbi:MAG: NAD(P)H-dependent oxidoreductase [Lentilitoribacter sp.]